MSLAHGIVLSGHFTGGLLVPWSRRCRQACSEPSRRQRKRAKDFTDIVRLVAAHPRLLASLTPKLWQLVKPPAG